jgi:hypothetical protein
VRCPRVTYTRSRRMLEIAFGICVFVALMLIAFLLAAESSR